jgi:hypothetical protein
MTRTGYYPPAWVMEFFMFLMEKASLLLGSKEARWQEPVIIPRPRE